MSYSSRFHHIFCLSCMSRHFLELSCITLTVSHQMSVIHVYYPSTSIICSCNYVVMLSDDAHPIIPDSTMTFPNFTSISYTFRFL